MPIRPPAGVNPAVVTRVTTAVANAIDKAGETASQVANAADTFELAKDAVSTMLHSRHGARVSGAVTELVNPAALKPATDSLTRVAERVGLPTGALVAGQKLVRAAGVASMAYEAYSAFANTKADTGSSLAQAGATLGVAVATLSTGPVGTAILAADIVTGGGVTGTARGLVALGDAALTGDRDALNQWAADAKSGEHGWAVKALANNQTVARVVGNGAEAVISGVGSAMSAVGNGWHALQAWAR